jgi:hypothetical protein
VASSSSRTQLQWPHAARRAAIGFFTDFVDLNVFSKNHRVRFAAGGFVCESALLRLPQNVF